MENSYQSIYKPVTAKITSRLAAFLIDAILFIIVLTGVLYLVTKALDFQTHLDNLYNEYKALGYYVQDEETLKWSFINESSPLYTSVIEKINESEIISKELGNVFQIVLNSSTIAIFIAMFTFEFIMPLILKNGATIGMKFFHIALLSKNGIKITPLQVFIRFLFGKLALLAIIPFYCFFYSFFNVTGGLFGTIVLIVIYVIQIVCLIKSKNHIGLQDMIASVYPVDDTQQRFFKSLDEKNKAVEKERKEMAKQKKVY